jgi:hypothetical protein
LIVGDVFQQNTENMINKKEKKLFELTLVPEASQENDAVTIEGFRDPGAG